MAAQLTFDELRRARAADGQGRTFSIYAMRTSFATQLTELGVPDGVVSELMRHKPTDVTRQHYVQRSLVMLRQAIDLIPAEAAHVPGLYREPAQEPNPVSSDARECAPEKATHAN